MKIGIMGAAFPDYSLEQIADWAFVPAATAETCRVSRTKVSSTGKRGFLVSKKTLELFTV